MEVNAEKSKMILVGKEKEVLAQTIQAMGKDLETVESFNYSGSKVTADGKCSEEVRNRLAIATSSLMNLSSIWRNSSISIKTKYRLLAKIIRAVVLYGCEAWTLDAALQNRINAFEMKCYTKLLRIPYTVRRRTNESGREELTQKGWKGRNAGINN